MARTTKLNALGRLHKDMILKKVDVKLGLGTRTVKRGLKVINIWNVANTNTSNNVFKFLPEL